MPILTQGADEAERISEENKKSSGFYRVPTCRLKDGDQVAVHFFTEVNALIAADMHSFIPTKPKPDEYTGDKWPEKMFGMCQNDRAFRVRDEAGNLTDEFEPGYGECYIHSAYAGQLDQFKKDMGRPDNQVFGLAVEREPVMEGGNVVGFRDAMVEYKDKDGKVWQIPKFVIFSQKFSNFWHPIKASSYISRTIRNADYVISRKENDYTATPAVLTPDLAPGTKGWEKYEKALELIGFDLGEHLLEQATPDWYKRWFIPGAVPEGGYGRKGDDAGDDAGDDSGEGSAPAAGTPASAPSVDQSVLDGFKSQLAARGGK